jgi:hypothetical protein
MTSRPLAMISSGTNRINARRVKKIDEDHHTLEPPRGALLRHMVVSPHDTRP